MSLLAALATIAACAFLGWRPAAWAAEAEQDRAERWTLRLVAGMVVLHVVLTALQAAGVRWSRASLTLAAVATGVALLARRHRDGVPPPARAPLGWGDGAAAVALAVFAVLALRLHATIADFVYHWGLKGERFFLAGGVDLAFLARRWNWLTHPDYPNLVPELYAVTGIAAGRFEAPAMMLWSVLFLAMTVAGVRGALRRGLEDRRLAQAGLAAIAVLVVAFAVGARLAGSADPALAVVLAGAWPALVGAPGRARDWQVGFLAAFAAGCKLEGVALAAILVALYLLRRARAGRVGLGAAALRAGVPTLLVVVPWLIASARLGLFLATNAGRFDPGRAGVIFAATWRALGDSPWHGAALVLLALPLAFVRRELRAYAAACVLQLGFYLYIYFSAPTDTAFHIAASFSRLLLHVLPAAMVAVLVAADRLLAAAGVPGEMIATRNGP
jgi:hypothetical protein